MKIEERKHYFIMDGIKVHWGAFWLPDKYEAITLFGHIFDGRDRRNLHVFLNSIYGKQMVNHERIHIIQAESFKTKYLGFYALYIWYWLVGFFKYKTDVDLAYSNNPFEREAYANENNFSYSETSWREYIV